MKYVSILFAVFLLTACGNSSPSSGGGGGIAGGSGSGGGSTDSTAPSQPTGLNSSAVSASQIDLSWSPSIDDTGVTGYTIYRDGSYLTSVSTTSYSDSGLAINTQYWYTVLAYDAAGNESIATSSSCATTIDAWTIRNLSDSGEYLTTIASSGSKYIAGSDTTIYESDDGVNWTLFTDTGFSIPSGLDYITWDGSRFIASHGTNFYTTTDGLSWTSTATGGFSDFRNILAMAVGGNTIVAVGSEGLLKFSTDSGSTWNDATTTLDSMTYVQDVMWDGSKFIAVTGSDTILYSSDGDNWTVKTVTTTNGWGFSDLAWDGTTYIAAAGSQVATSTNGMDWTVSDTTSNVEYVDWSPTLGMFASGGIDGVIHTSTDGSNWTSYGKSYEYGVLHDMVWTGGAFFTVGDYTGIISSSDGSTWSTRMFGSGLENVVWLNNQFIAMGTGGRLMSSTDGLSWNHYFTGDHNDWLTNIAWSGSEYMLTGGVYYSSASLDNWTTKHYLGALVNMFSVTWDGSQFVSIDGDVVYKSADGTSYTSASTNLSPTMYDMNWNGSQYVAVGSSGMIYTSPDATTWTQQTSNTSNNLRRITWNGSLYVVVGDSGTLLTSPDGITWTVRDSGTSSYLYSVIWTGSEFYAAGGYAIQKSTDGITWQSMSLPSGYFTIKGIAWNGSRMIAVGDDGLIMSLH
jgi:hypothetical protein